MIAYVRHCDKKLSLRLVEHPPGLAGLGAPVSRSPPKPADPVRRPRFVDGARVPEPVRHAEEAALGGARLHYLKGQWLPPLFRSPVGFSDARWNETKNTKRRNFKFP